MSTSLFGTMGNIVLGMIEFALSLAAFWPLAFFFAYLGEQSPKEVNTKTWTFKRTLPPSDHVWKLLGMFLGIHALVIFVIFQVTEFERPLLWMLLNSVLGIYAVILGAMVGLVLLVFVYSTLEALMQRLGWKVSETESTQSSGYQAVASDVPEHELEEGMNSGSTKGVRESESD